MSKWSDLFSLSVQSNDNYNFTKQFRVIVVTAYMKIKVRNIVVTFFPRERRMIFFELSDSTLRTFGGKLKENFKKVIYI